MGDKSQATEPTEEEIIAHARRYGLDCDYVEPKHCAFRGTSRCCQSHMKEAANAD